MTREQKMIVVMYLTESMNENEPSQSNNGSRISPSMKWNSFHTSINDIARIHINI